MAKKQFIVFKIPDIAWDGLDYLYDLIELKKNDLHFSLVSADNMEDARRKYFDSFLKNYYAEDREDLAWQWASSLCESNEEDEIVKEYGKDDGKILWEITCKCDDGIFSDKLYGKDYKLKRSLLLSLSNETIDTLMFNEINGIIAVTEIEIII